MSDGIVIAGGGLAGQRCAEALRRRGYEGALRIVCAEPHRPYDRPPLSKEMLVGDYPRDSLHYRVPGWYEERSIELLVGTAATSLSLAERRVGLSDGGTLRFDQLLIATGAVTRRLPVLDGFENVSTLRTVEDAERLRAVIAERRRLTIVGAGFVGQEVAASARALGAPVTMIEAGPAPLLRILGEQVGGWFAHLHRSEGVEVITGTTVRGVQAAGGRAVALELSTGEAVGTDHVLVAAGVAPDTSWLAGSGLDAGPGVPVDAGGRTGVDGVYAAGDAAATVDPLAGTRVPGSHWEAAGRQGARVASAMLGQATGEPSLASFWTDQYGIRIQHLGRASLADAVSIDGDPATRDFTATFTSSGRPVAVLLVGRPRDLPQARQMIVNGAPS
ncbi:MAG TPA: FAD-dependent oxidoreductase [Solirubrobacteraceae bacterium]|jgi:3-phenylpropionate/trans-cinnamate dioxygenase ferredoxin reductase subunit|nr:FAD-dependent oxidoreductase [Solirubrobacteraceae bacterium]